MASAATSEIELRPRTRDAEDMSAPDTPASPVRSFAVEPVGQEFSLPPVDGGKDAWFCLAGCFFVEALVWGFPFAFGVFQQYYSTHEPFQQDAGRVAAIGTTATGVMYIGAPLIFAFMEQYPQYRRMISIIGLPVAVLALVLSSFSSNVTHLILSQGLLYGAGSIFFYAPSILFLGEWFSRRKGLAFGIMWGGTGFAGVLIPFLISAALDRYGWRNALRIWAGIFFGLSAPTLYFVRPRVPVTRAINPVGNRRKQDFRFLLNPVYLVGLTGSLVQGLGYFIPSLYLPSYTSSLGMEPIIGTLTIALMNGCSVPGTILVGYLVDRLQVSTVIGLITFPAALAVFLLWGFGMSIPTLLIFSIIYGASAGGFSTTWTGVLDEMQKGDGPTGDIGTMFGILGAARGIGAVVSGPLSEALLGLGKFNGVGGYGTIFGVLIVFTGCTSTLGGAAFFAKRLRWI